MASWKCSLCGGDGIFYAGYDLGDMECPGCGGSGYRFGGGWAVLAVLVAVILVWFAI